MDLDQSQQVPLATSIVVTSIEASGINAGVTAEEFEQITQQRAQAATHAA